MALPTNRIKKVKLGDSTTYEIIPESLQKNGHKASLPTLTGDTTIATAVDLAAKQDTLVSGTNIKTINNQSILGSGDISIPADTNTWRPIKIASATGTTEAKSSDVSSGALYFFNDSTSIVKISYSGGLFRFDNEILTMWKDSTTNNMYLYSQDSIALNGHLMIGDARPGPYPTVHPTNSTGLAEPAAYMYGTGVTVQDWGDSGNPDIALSYPDHGGTIAVTSDIKPAMVSTTWSALKALRDNSQLVPGQQYRITDYDTSIDSSESAQLGASSAHHQFDIIVTADTESQLNEDARACGHQGDTYFATAFEYQSNVQFEYVLHEDTEEVQYDSEEIEDYYHDTIMEGTYVNGTPVLYKTETGEYGEEVDYQDRFWYLGDMELNGVTYNKWQKDQDEDERYYLTRVIVVNKQFVENVAVTKIGTAYSCSLWKLKYCLDNDQRRFRWADSYSGKGVIYRMIDEWGNDCPYDFKNMQFKRNILNGKYSREGDGDDKWLYTFSYITKTTPDFEVVDASIAGNREDLQNHDNTPGGVVGNVIGPRYDFSLSQETGPMTTPLVLNDIVFVGSYVYPNPQNPVFDGFHSNVFGDDCYSNTMAGNLLYDNRFGVGCHDNCVEHYCVGNVFGRNNFSNVLESVSDKNTFGPDCSGNHLGGECYNNIFEWGCKDNTVNNDNSNNYFAASCRDNYIDSGSYGNKFGAECIQNFAGEYSHGLVLGRECSTNRFEQDCEDITFGNGCSDNHIAGLTRRCIFDAGVSNIELTSDDTSATSSNCIQNVHIHSGVMGTSSSARKAISVPDRNLPYSIDYYANNSQTIFLD